MKKDLLLLALTLLFFKLSFAQDTEPPEIFPASPSAAELGKYGSYPVNYSTGLPQIDIPLYTIETGDIKIPISLKYHASGIKVNEQNSWVGLGWSLDTGGIISLEVRETPDELEPNIYDIPDENEITTFLQNNPYDYDNWYISFLKENSWVKDAYHINLPTVSGSFFLDSDAYGEVNTKLPPDKFRVERSGVNTADGYFYKITDKMGMKYFFSDFEESEIQKPTGNPDISYHTYNERYKSSYLLSKIDDTKGNSIQYTYGNEYTVYNTGESHSKSITHTKMTVTAAGQTIDESYTTNYSPITTSDSQSWSYTKKLSEINFVNGRIRFVTGSNPQYVGVYYDEGIYLDEMIVEKNDEFGVFTEIKRIKFYYSSIGDPTTYYEPSTVNKYRFKLDKIVEINPAEYKEIASFTYNTDVALPSYNSYSIDYFGYFNGKNNPNLMPKREITFPNSYYEMDIIQVGDANRSIDEDNMKAGILTKISYPTSGYTKFSYEPNVFYGVNPFQFEYFEDFSMHLEGIGDINFAPDHPNNINPDEPVIRTESYSFYTPQPTQLFIETNFSCGCPNGRRQGYAEYTISVDGVEVDYLRFSNSANNYVQDGNGNQMLVGTTEDQIIVGPGNVTVELEVFGEGFTADLNNMYEVKYDDTDQNVEGFGLRVESITNYDADGSFISKKAYEYLIPETNISSGKLVMNGSHADMDSRSDSFVIENVYEQYSSGGLSNGCYPKVTETNSYNYSSSSRQGYENTSVTYEYVTEYDMDSINNTLGRTEYKFTSNPNFILDHSRNNSLWINNGSKRSKLLLKKVFNNDNRELTREENFYSEEQTVFNYRNDFKFYLNMNITPCYCNCEPDWVNESDLDFISVRYRPNFGLNWYKKDRTEITNYFYDSNGTLTGEVMTATDYTYNNLNQEIQKISTTTSDQAVTETSFKYAQDLNDSQLIVENRIGIPLETEESKNSEIISHRKAQYAYTPNSLYLPYKIFNKKGGLVDINDNKDLKITFDRYENGNITQYHTENGTSTTIIWGYNDQYPIAKIENATYSQVESYVSNLQFLSDADDDSCIDSDSCDEKDLRTALNALRTALPDAMVTTYTYDPLIGVTSITDPRGNIIYYEYDDFNRLKHVKDKDGNILSENEYHYATPN